MKENARITIEQFAKDNRYELTTYIPHGCTTARKAVRITQDDIDTNPDAIAHFNISNMGKDFIVY